VKYVGLYGPGPLCFSKAHREISKAHSCYQRVKVETFSPTLLMEVDIVMLEYGSPLLLLESRLMKRMLDSLGSYME
jgi:hypothetical protein